MRMSQEKVKDLAAQIVAMLAEHPKVHLQAGEDALRVEIGSAILDDLREERDIEAEVDALILQHSREIDAENMDIEMLRKKFRNQIARQRGFVI